MSNLPTPDVVTKAALTVLKGQVSCQPVGERLVLDTPYVLQDGHLLRVHIDRDADGRLLISDGGFVQRQVEIFSRSATMLRDRVAEVGQMAVELNLKWDQELSFAESDLRAALQRISVLARAVDRSLSLLHARSPRPKVALRERLGRELADAGFSVRPRARIPVGTGLKEVVIDHLVRRNGAQAAVEVLAGRTGGGALISVDRAIANFHVLTHFQYPGAMVAVYEEGSPAAAPRLLERFENAGPDRARLVAEGEALPLIRRELAG